MTGVAAHITRALSLAIASSVTEARADRARLRGERRLFTGTCLVRSGAAVEAERRFARRRTLLALVAHAAASIAGALAARLACCCAVATAAAAASPARWTVATHVARLVALVAQLVAPAATTCCFRRVAVL